MIRTVQYVAVRVLLVDAVVLVGVGAIGVLRGWSTRESWGEALVWGGLAAVALGGLAVRGAWDSRLAHVGFAASAGRVPLAERAGRVASETAGAYRRLLFLLLVAAPLVLAGIAIDPRFS